jgi:hypothetical protein
MTYFRMQPPSHGTGPLAPGHLAMPLPGATSLSATPARLRLAVKVQPPRACLGTGQIPAAGRLSTRLHASPLSSTDLAQAARSNILPNIVSEIRSTDFVDCLVRLQAQAAGDDFFLDLGGAAEDRLHEAEALELTIVVKGRRTDAPVAKAGSIWSAQAAAFAWCDRAAITRHGIVSPRRNSPSRGVATTTTPNQRPRMSQPSIRMSTR